MEQPDMLEEIIPAFRDGDPKAFDAFFKQYYKALCFFADQLLDDMAEAEDIVKDSYVKLWNRHNDFDHPQSIKSFLYTTTRNACLNNLRHAKVKHAYQKEILYLDVQQQDDYILQRMIRSELMQSIYAEIAQLSPKRQEVFRMFYFDGLKLDEIAAKLNLSLFTVKEHKAKALSQLRLKFSDRDLALFLLIATEIYRESHAIPLHSIH